MRCIADGKPKRRRAYSNRLDALLAESAAPLAANAPRLLVYPFGDYGQSSLDVTPENLAALRAAVARHFDFAIYYDEAGFVPTDFSAAICPARVVPGHWTTNELVLHCARATLTRARLDLANCSTGRASMRRPMCGSAARPRPARSLCRQLQLGRQCLPGRRPRNGPQATAPARWN
jgi:hypothetical protein